jgi:hypothetical protein
MRAIVLRGTRSLPGVRSTLARMAHQLFERTDQSQPASELDKRPRCLIPARPAFATSHRQHMKPAGRRLHLVQHDPNLHPHTVNGRPSQWHRPPGRCLAIRAGVTLYGRQATRPAVARTPTGSTGPAQPGRRPPWTRPPTRGYRHTSAADEVAMMFPSSPLSLALAFPLARHILHERHRAAEQAGLARAARRNHARLRAQRQTRQTPGRAASYSTGTATIKEPARSLAQARRRAFHSAVRQEPDLAAASTPAPGGRQP